MFIGCGDDETADPSLDGTWVGDKMWFDDYVEDAEDIDYVELNFNKGTLIFLGEGSQLFRATYTTSGNNITIEVKDVHGSVLNEALEGFGEEAGEFGITAFENKWYSITGLLTDYDQPIKMYMAQFEITDAEYNEALSMLKQTGTYTIDGNKLTLKGVTPPIPNRIKTEIGDDIDDVPQNATSTYTKK
jgi:hypothetical protein